MTILVMIIAAGAAYSLRSSDVPEKNDAPLEKIQELPAVYFARPGNSHDFALPAHVFQTFNNCGPATLSMILAYYGINKSQQELGQQMRPYQNQRGDNDDKSVFADEFVQTAETFGLKGVVRPAGNLETLKTLVANDIPVVVRTWLRPGEDIGHYRIVRGFDEQKKIIIQDDSYYGKDRQIGYTEFLGMWQPFNYEYFVIYQPEQEQIIAAVLGSQFDERTAWQSAYDLTAAEAAADPANIYPRFSAVVALYHLDRSAEAVVEFEKIETRLPSRMLWYQLEPILAFRAVGDYEKVFSLVNAIINRQNRAFSELYQIRGDIYIEQGNLEHARKEFELAVYYNANYAPARLALMKIEDL